MNQSNQPSEAGEESKKVELNPVQWMNKAVKCLYLEVHESIADDISKRWNEAKQFLSIPPSIPNEEKQDEERLHELEKAHEIMMIELLRIHSKYGYQSTKEVIERVNTSQSPVGGKQEPPLDTHIMLNNLSEYGNKTDPTFTLEQALQIADDFYKYGVSDHIATRAGEEQDTPTEKEYFLKTFGIQIKDSMASVGSIEGKEAIDWKERWQIMFGMDVSKMDRVPIEWLYRFMNEEIE